MNLLTRLASRLFSYRVEILYLLEWDQMILRPSSVPVNYRLGTLDDLSRLEPTQFDYDEASIAYSGRRLAAGDAFVLGEIDDQLVFYCWLCFGQFQVGMDRFWESPVDMACVYKVFTHAAHRGNCIYPASYRFIACLAREQGIRRFITSIDKANQPSRRSADKIGFKEHGRMTAWRVTDQDHYWPDVRTAALLSQERPTA